VFSWISILQLLGPEFSNYAYLPSVGASRGILMAWRDRLTSLSNSMLGSHSISVQFCSAEGQHWRLTCVYGPQGNEAKIQFLQELRDVRQACSGPWLLAGDFNLILHEEDKNNPNVHRAMMGRFRRCINDLALKEIQLHGHKFTWSNGQTNPTLVKLDRVLYSVDWEELFLDCLLQSSVTQDSDHRPLILSLSDLLRGKRRFHFESFWPRLDGFQDAVAAASTSVQPGPCHLRSLSAKLKATAKGLQSWSDTKIGHIASQLELAKELLHQMDIAQDRRILSSQEQLQD
jgi:exonuclease III